MNQRLFTFIEVAVIGALVVFVMYIGGAFKGPDPAPTPRPPTPAHAPTATRPRPSPTPGWQVVGNPDPTPIFAPVTKPAGLIAFESARDGNSEIYVVDAASGVQTNLTNHPAEDYLIAWSPDGARIAFLSTRTGWLEIYAMNADGTGVTQLTNTFGTNTAYSTASWSPDGTQLVGVRNNMWSSVGHSRRPDFLDRIRADGSGATTLYKSNDVFLGLSTWSPDGQYIATIFSGSPLFGLYVGKAGETSFNPNSISSNVSCFNYAWSPDGKLACPGGSTIYLFDPASPDIKWLDTGVNFVYISSLAWSPDGEYFLLVGYPLGQIDSGPSPKIYLANAAGSESRELSIASELVVVSSLSWAADSQWFAFSARASEQFNIYIVNIYDPNQPGQLTISAGDNFSPQWQP